MSGTNPPRRVPAAVLAVVLTALAVLLGAAPAQAHDYLVSSSPAAGSTVSAPLQRVSLTFDAAVLSTGNGSDVLAVTGPSGKHFETGCARVSNTDVSAAVRLGAAGDYTVSWRIVSADGHPVAGSYRFDYAPPSGASAAPGSASGPSCGNAQAGGGSTSTAKPTSTASVVVLIAVVAGVLVLLVVAGVVVALVLTRRRP